MGRRIVVAAPHSGSGKTTVASLICLTLRERGLRVQPFKLGPDYLDPTHLSRAAGRPARNLDSFLLSPERLRELFVRADAQADVSVIEGVMGLHDGRDPSSDEHSTADLARTLQAPVILVIDASGMARTVAAVAAGLRDYGAGTRVAGVILNRVGSAGHASLCETALAQIGLPVMGFLTKQEQLILPERHLGLVSAEQAGWDTEAALKATDTLDIGAVLQAAENAPISGVRSAGDSRPVRPTARIGYALDEAFHFYYPDALDELREAGAKLVPFSPLHDDRLPSSLGGLLLGGGYPELYAADLSANHAMRAAIRAFAVQGKPLLGECGGLMYLSERLDTEGRSFEMCGVVPYRTRMAPRLTLGYREATALRPSPLAPSGAVLRGHEFHHSVLTHEATHPAYRWTAANGQEVMEGYAQGNVLASYLHLHYASDPALAARLVRACS